MEFVEVLAELQTPISPEDATTIHGGDEKTEIGGGEESYDLLSPDDPRVMSIQRVARLFGDDPASPSVSTIQVALRRLIDHDHLTHEYLELLSNMFRITVEALIMDQSLYSRMRYILNKNSPA